MDAELLLLRELKIILLEALLILVSSVFDFDCMLLVRDVKVFNLVDSSVCPNDSGFTRTWSEIDRINKDVIVLTYRYWFQYIWYSDTATERPHTDKTSRKCERFSLI